jgi:hypothetical protein
VVELYQPGAIVVCGGADSLSGDRLGCFNLSLQGHAHCMQFLASFNVPMLVLGGGGYTMRNVARCWCYETGRLLGEELPDECAFAPHLLYVGSGPLRGILLPLLCNSGCVGITAMQGIWRLVRQSRWTSDPHVSADVWTTGLTSNFTTLLSYIKSCFGYGLLAHALMPFSHA